MTKTNFPNGIIAPFSVSGTDVVVLTDNSGGTGADTIAVIGATYSQTEVANAIASLSDKINELIASASAE
tara:strand:- start:10398 stop:10607 length:210 start_codon:yes stop_codon:yes gene_type:complete